MTAMRVCKDCKAEAKLPMNVGRVAAPARPTPYPGPRCATHHRLEKRRISEAAHRRRVGSRYGLAPGEYEELLEIQGGVCAGCKREVRTGKRLAVDHDHKQAALDGHDTKKGCAKCIRGLLCHRCNDVLAHFRDDSQLLRNLAFYLEQWPSQLLERSKPEPEPEVDWNEPPGYSAGVAELGYEGDG